MFKPKHEIYVCKVVLLFSSICVYIGIISIHYYLMLSNAILNYSYYISHKKYKNDNCEVFFTEFGSFRSNKEKMHDKMFHSKNVSHKPVKSLVYFR